MDSVEETNLPTAQGRPIFWRLMPVAVIAAGFAGFFLFGFDDYMSLDAISGHRQELLAWRTDNYGLAAFSFIFIYCLAVAFSVPGAAWLTIAGGFVFGTVLTTLYVMAGATMGAVIIFLIARYALGDLLHAKAGPWVRKMEAGFQENALSYLLVLRLVPLFPFWLVNLVPALLGVPLRTYFIGTLFGIIPGCFVFSSVGNGLGAMLDNGEMPDLNTIFEPQFIIPIIGLAVLSLIPIAYKKFRKNNPSS